MKSKIFVFDTNVVVSAFILPNSTSRKAFEYALQNGEIATSKECFEEFETIFLRPKMDKYISLKDRIELITEIKNFLKFCKTNEEISICRDSKDNKFLEVAVSSNASSIINSDLDLPILNPFRKILILNPTNFLLMSAK